MTLSDVWLAEIARHLKRNNLAQARHVARSSLIERPQDGRLNAIAGIIACQMNDFPAGIGHFRAALAVMPDDAALRVNLARAYMEVKDFTRLVQFTEGTADLRLLRMRAFAHWQLGSLENASADYHRILNAAPEDYESWNNLGNLASERGAFDEAANAFEKSIRMRPDLPVLYMNYSRALANRGAYDDRMKVMREARSRFDNSYEILVEAGAAAAAIQDHASAEEAYRSAIKCDPKAMSAYVDLGMLFESLNRLDSLEMLIADAEAEGLAGDGIHFLRAWLMRRRGQFVEALPIATAVGNDIDPVRRFQLIGEIQDRLGDAAAAFAAFSAMNRSVAVPPELKSGDKPSFRDAVTAASKSATFPLAGDGTPRDATKEAETPIFILGFPRSGTTLTDTLLMNLPSLHVMEEQPVMRILEDEMGDLSSGLATLQPQQIAQLRLRYFEIVEEICPAPSATRIVDKFPLHMARIPLIHRIFPDAPIVLVERHPCDVVLSCFMSNFQPNRAMIHFLDIVEAAKLYDAVWSAWTNYRTHFRLNVHVVRYERMVQDLKKEMRPLLDFLGIAWTDDVLDNLTSAARRPHIQTASYAQVTEPIYTRARYRWRRYEQQLAPVLPILEPWARMMGYDM